MIKYRRIALAVMGSILLALALPVRASGLERLHAFIEGTRSARAGFTQTVVARSGRKPQQASGVMMFSRPGKFRWEYDRPYRQLIVGDGDKLWVYDPELKQVTTRKLAEAIGSSPAALLAGDNALDKNFILKDAGSSDGLEWVEAQPKSGETSFESLRMGFAGDMLKVMELRDTFGQTTTLVFSQLERNPPLPAQLFRFTPPKGADVIGG